MFNGAYTPEQPPTDWLALKAEYDRLYLEKCREVNELELRVESYRSMAELAVKQKRELESRLGGQKTLLEERSKQLEELKQTIRDMDDRLDYKERLLEDCREQLEDAKQTIRELAAEQLPFGFTPDVEATEELPEALMEELPLWALQPVTTQDILCLSSALKNLYDIHKCDGWLLYNRLAKVLEQKIKEYCGED